MKCSVEGCPNDAARNRVIKGLCHAHHSRIKRHGDVMAHIPLKKSHNKEHWKQKRRARDGLPILDLEKIRRQTFV